MSALITVRCIILKMRETTATGTTDVFYDGYCFLLYFYFFLLIYLFLTFFYICSITHNIQYDNRHDSEQDEQDHAISYRTSCDSQPWTWRRTLPCKHSTVSSTIHTIGITSCLPFSCTFAEVMIKSQAFKRSC